MKSNIIIDKEWITLKEASEITGRSIQALRLLINRKRIDKVKKMQDNGPGYWVIHKDVISQISINNKGDKDTYQTTLSGIYKDTSHDTLSHASQMISIPIEYLERQQEERDKLMQGLMMYRYKYEDFDSKFKLLPAPPEMMIEEIRKRNEITEQARKELDQAKKLIQEKEQIIQAELSYREQLSSTLHEQESKLLQMQLELDSEKKRSWWKKLLRLK